MKPPIATPELIDYRVGGGLFFLFDNEANEYQVTISMLPWHDPERLYLFRSPDRKEAREFFYSMLHKMRDV